MKGAQPLNKFLAAVLACIFIALTGCDFIFPGVDVSDDESSSVWADYLSEFENRWGFQRLSTNLKISYGEVYTAVKESFEKDESVTISDSKRGTHHQYIGLRVTLSKPLKTRDDARLLYTAFLFDNPQFFYIGNTYSYEGYRAGGTDFYNIFCLVYSMSAQERAVAAARLEDTVSRILNGLYQKGAGGQFETQLYLHDELLKLCSYENMAVQTDDPAALYPTAFTAYGALAEGKAVCEGYSRAMQLLLHRAGIECTLVSGNDQNNVSHMWNLVTIDGRNYHLDPTWNDGSDKIHHSYFNLTTAEILLSHKIDKENIGIDTCTSREANYYLRKERQLDTVRRDDIAKTIADAVIQGDSIIDLRFTKNTFAAARLFINNRELLIQKVNHILNGSEYLMWNYEEYNVNDIYYTLTLYKHDS